MPPVPRAETVLSRPADAEFPELRIWPSTEVLAIFRFHAAQEIDFDVDLRRFRGRSGSTSSAVFCGTSVAGWARAVLMDPEGDDGHPVLGFDVEADRVASFGFRGSGPLRVVAYTG